MGRRRLREEDNIRRDFLLLLNVKGWRRLAGHRDIWRRTIEDARVRLGLSRHLEEKKKKK
jgi:hypothetical protein